MTYIMNRGNLHFLGGGDCGNTNFLFNLFKTSAQHKRTRLFHRWS